MQLVSALMEDLLSLVTKPFITTVGAETKASYSSQQTNLRVDTLSSSLRYILRFDKIKSA